MYAKIQRRDGASRRLSNTQTLFDRLWTLLGNAVLRIIAGADYLNAISFDRMIHWRFPTTTQYFYMFSQINLIPPGYMRLSEAIPAQQDFYSGKRRREGCFYLL